MKPFLKLLKPHLSLFIAAMFALFLAAFFNSAMTGLVTSLMDGVMTNQATTTQSRADELFGYRERLEDVKEKLQSWGVPLDKFEHRSGQDALVNPISWAVLALILFSLQALFEFGGTYLMGWVGLKIVVNLRQDLIDKIMTLPLLFFKMFSTGDILARINTDVLRVQQAISVKMAELFKSSTNAIVFLILAFFLNWKLSLTLFLLVPLVGWPIAIFSRKIRKHASRSQANLGSLTAHFKEVLVGIRIVKGFQKEKFESQKLEIENQSFFRHALRELRIVAMTTPVMSIMGMLIIVAFVCYGSVIIQSGAMTQGDFLFYILVIYQLYQPIKRIARANSEIQQAVGVLPRLNEVLDWQNPILEPTHPKRFEHFPAIREISFRNVHFAYTKSPEALPVLHGIDLDIAQGSVVALVGASGSGKSTMVNLLPRFYDVDEGAILVNGLDIRDLALCDLRALFAMVTQVTVLFNDSVHNNIAYGMKDVPREAVIAAANKAYAHHFIEELPNGYDTVIGESGDSLSGGQRQRISIARAILKDAPILILDEATSALDTESEREVQLALENLMKVKTTVVIAHRLSTIRQADDIVVLEKGRIVERGTHESLIEKNGVYKRLIQIQEVR